MASVADEKAKSSARKRAKTKRRAYGKKRGKHGKSPRRQDSFGAGHETEEQQHNDVEDVWDDAAAASDDSADSKDYADFPHRLSSNYMGWDDERRSNFIHSIIGELRVRCSREGMSPGDPTSLYIPPSIAAHNEDETTGVRHGTDSKSWFAGSDHINSFFLDSFLYSNHDMNRMIDEGKLQLFYCKKCHKTMHGECKRKKDEDRQREEAQRRQEVEVIKQRWKEERNARKKGTPTAHQIVRDSVGTADKSYVPASDAALSSTSNGVGLSSSVGACSSSSPSSPASGAVIPSHHSVTSLSNTFAILTVDPVHQLEAEQEETNGEEGNAEAGDVESGGDDDSGPSLASLLDALPPINLYTFPRHTLLSRQCRYCRASSAHISARSHLTHSLSVAQGTDMMRMAKEHVDFNQPIGVRKRTSSSSSLSSSSHSNHQRSRATSNVSDKADEPHQYQHPQQGNPSNSMRRSSFSLDGSFLQSLPYAVDIGSRLGNMLYLGLLHTSCQRWIGVEMDAFFVGLSRKITRMFGLSDHVRIVEDDIANRSSLLHHAKLVAFFNSFELHVSRERHRQLLRYLTDTVSQRDQYLLTCPSLLDIYTRAESEVNVNEWVDLVAQDADAFLYRVR